MVELKVAGKRTSCTGLLNERERNSGTGATRGTAGVIASAP